MVDARFSAEAFARLGPNTPAAEELAHELGAEVAVAVRAAVEGEICRVVEQLRGLGHELHEWERAARPQFNAHGYSFGPSQPGPAEGWLAVEFDTSAFVMFARAAAETVVGPEHQGDGSPTDDADPF